ncbi:MAG: choice-of-anchor D domain-containing protein, partial [Candidatus Cloacimonetes bacterium]|nr:choice-of-anchor D domain-containing protein [Candidatus Cloacimonadota bacterium]
MKRIILCTLILGFAFHCLSVRINKTFFDNQLISSIHTNGSTSPANNRDEHILHYDGDNNSGVGSGAASTYTVCARYTPEELVSYNGAILERIQFYILDDATSITLKVFEGLNETTPGSLLVDQIVLSFSPNSWNDITLTNPITIDSSSDYWVGYEIVAESGYPAGADSGPVIADKGAKIYWNSTWSNLIDLNASLDENFNIRAILQTNNSTIITLGTGTTTNMSLPIEPYYGYSYSQCIYLQSEMTVSSGTISRIWYHYNGGTDLSASTQWVIYMGHTTMSSFSANNSWVPVSNLTLVGTYILDPYPTDDEWIEFVLDTPFAYNHIDNLVIAVEDNQGGWDGSSDEFFCTGTPNYRGLEYHNDSTNPNPNSPPNGILRAAYANVQLEFLAISEEPFFYCTPSSFDFGTVFTGFSSNPETFTITNHGGSELIIANPISLETGSNFTLNDMNSYPITLETSISASFEVSFNSMIEGTITDNIIITDNISRETHYLPIQGTGIDVTINDFPYNETFDTSILPLGWIIDPIVSSDSWELANYEIGGHGATAEATGNGGYMLVIDDSSPDTVPAHLYTPPFDLNTLIRPTLTFKYWIGDSSNTSSLHIDVITPYGIDSSIAIVTDSDGANSWETYNVDLTSYSGMQISLDFRGMESSSFYGDICLDDVSIYELGILPSPTVLVNPQDNALNIPLDGQLEWDSVYNTDGYYLSLGTDYPPTNVLNNFNLGNVLIYDYTSLMPESTYFWQVIPYNSVGNAEECPIWSFSTIPAGLIEIGNDILLNQSLPIEPYYGYSYSQSIYLQSEINIISGQIENISYHYNNYANLNSCNSWVIYLAETQKTSFESTLDWIPITQFIEVYNGPLPTIQSDGWIEFDLTTSFAYNNVDNLVIAVEENQGGYTSTGNEDFYCSAVAENRSIYYYNDSINPNPIAPPTASAILSVIPNVRLLFEDYVSVPNVSSLLNPLSTSVGVRVTDELNWSQATGAEGYYLSLGTDTPPTNVLDMIDLGNVTSYQYNNLMNSTNYFWQITPYNANGNAVNCPIWEFTTRIVSDQLSVPDEFSTIQTAIDASIDGETVLVQPGTYYENIDFSGKAITVASLFHTNGDSLYIETTIINGNDIGHCVNFSSGETNASILTGFTVTNGYAVDGGGIYCQDSSPSINHCTISDNQATEDGGGIKVDGIAAPILHDLTIDNNQAQNGGGVSVTGGASIEANNMLIASNSTTNRAGGLESLNSYVFLTNCQFDFNNASNAGGALFLYYGEMKLDRCLIDYNNSGRGGAIYLQGDNEFSTTFCTLADNGSTMGGNSMYVNGATEAYFINTIFQSQGPSEIGFTGSASNLNFYYSRIINTPQAIENDNGSTVFIDASVISDDPLFVDPMIGDYTLSYNSPCINAGTAYFENGGTIFVDLQPEEYSGTAPDMGMYEFEGVIEPVLSYTPETIEYGTLMLYQTSLAHIIVTNEGFGILNISNISIDSDDIELSATGYAVEPGFSETLNLMYTPTELGEFNYTLSFNTNSVGQELVNIPVSATVLTPPQFSLSSDELSTTIIGEIA